MFPRRRISCWLALAVALSFLHNGPSLCAADRPNILFAIADDWSFGHAGAYGCGWVQTPAFDSIAKRGILFQNAFTPNAKCAPSRSILVTGRNSWQLEQAANHICFFPPKFKSVVEALGENGYFTGYTGKGWAPGVAKDANGKPRLMTGRNYSRRKAKPPFKAISNNDYAANFGDFLQDVPQGVPWFFWYGATEPHRAYEAGAGAKKGKSADQIDRVPAYWPDNSTVRNDMLDYSVEVEHYDDHLGRILQQIADAGQTDNTLVLATSDHGMPFPRVKGQAYLHSNHVPLAVMWPAGIKNPGRSVTDFVSFADVAPTFLDAAGIDWTSAGMSPSPGTSLSDIFRSTKSGQCNPARNHMLIGKERHDVGRPHDWGYPIRGIIRDGMLFISNYKPDRWPAGNPETGYLNCDASPTKTDILHLRRSGANTHFWQLCFGKRPAEELYDLKADPDCVRNLADDPAYAKQKQQLKQQMVAELKEQNDPRMFDRGNVFDEYIYSTPGTRNFYERYMSGEKLKAGWVSPDDFEAGPLE